MAGYGSCIKNYSNLINSLDRLAGAVLIVIGGQRKPGAEAGLYYAASLLIQVSLLENGRTWLDSWKSKESCCI